MSYRATRTIAVASLLVVLAVASSPSVLAEEKYCDLCGKRITGTFFRYKDKRGNRPFYICAECERTSPRCAICNLPIKPPDDWDGKKELYCARCFESLQRCFICGKVRKRGDKFYKNSRTGQHCCADCYKNAPKCASCKAPMKMGNGVSIYGKIICRSCSQLLPKCDCCKLPIVGRAISYRYADGRFCEHCVKTKKHCHVCGIPICGKHTTLADGRCLCNGCKKTAVLSRALLRIIHGRVVDFLKRKINLDVKHDYELKMVRSRKDLGGTDGEIEGRELGLFQCIDGEFRILILDGVTEAMCYETVAHEYAHAWHAEHGMQYANKETKEGFAQWIASKTLEHFGYKDGLRRLRARKDPHYGTGYQKLWAIEKTKGVEGVFEHVRKKSRFKRER